MSLHQKECDRPILLTIAARTTGRVGLTTFELSPPSRHEVLAHLGVLPIHSSSSAAIGGADRWMASPSVVKGMEGSRPLPTRIPT